MVYMVYDMKKRVILIVGAIVIAALILGNLFYYNFFVRGSFEKVSSYVNDHYEDLQIFVDSIGPNERKNTINVREFKYDTISRVYVWGDGETIEFHVTGFGIAPSSVEYGFIYSEDDSVVGAGNIRVGLETTDKGWKWEEPGTDNYQYIQKIRKNWYWFERHV